MICCMMEGREDVVDDEGRMTLQQVMSLQTVSEEGEGRGSDASLTATATGSSKEPAV